MPPRLERPVLRRPFPALVAVAATLLVLAGCSSGDDDRASDRTPPPAPAPSASPSPTLPAVRPVRADREVVLQSLDSGPVLSRAAETPPDSAAVEALADEVGDWLDAHLDNLQRGGSGLLRRVAAPGLLAEAGPTAKDAVTTELTTREQPVREAGYKLVVGHEGAPQWVSAAITVATAGGGTARATLLFEPGEDGPVLVAFGPEAEVVS